MIKPVKKDTKTMKKQFRKVRHTAIIRRLSNVQLVIIAGCLLAGFVAGPMVYADQYTQQIQALQSQNSQTQSTVNSLQSQADNYQEAINQLQDQINAIQGSIQANQIKQVELQQQIQADNQKITQEKQILGDDIKEMYVNGQMSTIEELATSKSLSDFVNAETYRQAVQSNIQSTLIQINQTEDDLKNQQTEVTQLLQTEQTQQTQLNGDQQQQAQMLSFTQAQQASYTAQIQANNAQISQLQAEQAAANAAEARSVNVASGNGTGNCEDPSNPQGTGPVGGNGIRAANYPNAWCNAAKDTIYDANGILNRECTSFAYWYFVNVEGNSGFSVSGNAGWWWETSSYPAITYSSAVQVGAIGVEPSTATSTAEVPSLHDSSTGHVMIVVALPGQTYDGVSVPMEDVMVASMNEDEEGHFIYDLWPSADLWYINPQ